VLGVVGKSSRNKSPSALKTPESDAVPRSYDKSKTRADMEDSPDPSFVTFEWEVTLGRAWCRWKALAKSGALGSSNTRIGRVSKKL
jgi:hypothetical protein